MRENDRPAISGWAILAAIIVGVPLLVVGVVGIQTWVPLQHAGVALDKLDRSLGNETSYCPSPSGEIPAQRMELFLELRAALVGVCDDYGDVQKGFEAVEALDSKEPEDPREVGGAVAGLGRAALAITPFLARFFEKRNEVLLAGPMGLQEYTYIYAVAYHDLLLAGSTRSEIFSDGEALSPEASTTLKLCLTRQLEESTKSGGRGLRAADVEAELAKMEGDPARLIWQDGLPAAVDASVAPYRKQLDSLFCGATAGLEMERGARRALRVALE